jgi:hypothetical protein
LPTPVAWYGMNKWFAGLYIQNYYKLANIFYCRVCWPIAIALITVSFQSIKQPFANPVESLREPELKNVKTGIVTNVNYGVNYAES